MDIINCVSPMNLPMWIALMLFLDIFSPIIARDVAQGTDRCPENEASAHAYVIPCLQKGEKFLKRYFRKYSNKSYDKCSDYKKFEGCINPLLNRCSGVLQHLPNEWVTTIELLNCACAENHEKHQECDSALTCMENEIEGFFADRCEERFKLNIKQKTLSQCHFLHDYIYCKKTLVTSACGAETGNLLFLVHQVAAWQSFSCDIAPLPDYQGLQYSADCPVDLAEQIDSCLDHLSVVLRFNDDNDLIPFESSKTVNKGCRAYMAYQNCLNRWKEKCEVGVTMAMEANAELRVYLLKMEYICEEAGNDYISNVGCYKEILEQDSLSQCYPIWGSIEPLLKITAFEYYCMADSQSTIRLKDGLHNLTKCYGDVISETCSETARTAMEGLIDKAFQDPLYLRLDYVPDCQLHTRDPYDSPPKVNKKKKDNTNKLRHRHQRHRKKPSDSRQSQANQYVNKPSSVRNQINSSSKREMHLFLQVTLLILQLITIRTLR